jgi:GTPase SAR1 family protein
MHRLAKGAFNADTAATIGVEFASSRGARQSAHETPDLGHRSKHCYRNAVGVVLVFDVTCRPTFDELPAYLDDVHAVVQLVGNKCDLAAEREVTILGAEGFARERRMADLETSAKIGDNVWEAFVGLAAAITGRELEAFHRTANPLVGQPKNECC